MRTPAIPMTALLLLTACTANRVVYSDPGEEGNLAPLLDPLDPDDPDPDTGDGENSGDAGSGSGIRCPPLPTDRPLVAGLSTGWAVEDESGALLQLGSHAFGCGWSITDVFENVEACPDLWALELALPPLSIEEIELSADNPGVVVHHERSSDGLGCGTNTIHSNVQGFGGTLRILDMNEHCIVGELVGLQFPTDDLPDLSGVFLAERC